MIGKIAAQVRRLSPTATSESDSPAPTQSQHKNVQQRNAQVYGEIDVDEIFEEVKVKVTKYIQVGGIKANQSEELKENLLNYCSKLVKDLVKAKNIPLGDPNYECTQTIDIFSEARFEVKKELEQIQSLDRLLLSCYRNEGKVYELPELPRSPSSCWIFDPNNSILKYNDFPLIDFDPEPVYYSGEFFNKKPDGNGMAYFSTTINKCQVQQIYQGQFKQGIAHGFGRVISMWKDQRFTYSSLFQVKKEGEPLHKFTYKGYIGEWENGILQKKILTGTQSEFKAILLKSLKVDIDPFTG